MGRRRFTSLAGAVLCLGAAGFVAAPHVFAAEKPTVHRRPAVSPALPSCSSFPTPPPGSVTLFVPPLPGKNCRG